MISALSVHVGGSLAHLYGAVFWSFFRRCFFVVLPKRKQGRWMSGLSFELSGMCSVPRSRSQLIFKRRAQHSKGG